MGVLVWNWKPGVGLCLESVERESDEMRLREFEERRRKNGERLSLSDWCGLIASRTLRGLYPSKKF